MALSYRILPHVLIIVLWEVRVVYFPIHHKCGVSFNKWTFRQEFCNLTNTSNDIFNVDI